MKSNHTALYRITRSILGLALGFYFRRIERFHVHRVPQSGPVLFASNHPNSLTDSFVIGAAVSRKVNFVATVQLFRFKPIQRLLSLCGVIPINRVRDDPKAMRSVAETFEACYRVLERGEAVGIFPEGVTYDDSALKEIKSGVARMALELEHRHGGKLGLRIVPVGLTYSAKESYRSDVLVNFGEPIQAADFIEDYTARRKACIVKLTSEIERQIQSLILHIPRLEWARVVEGVKCLDLENLAVGARFEPAATSPRARELVLGQRITEAVEEIHRTQPDRAAAFARKLDSYNRWLSKLRISDESLALFPKKEKLAEQSLLWAAIAVAGAPVAVYGWAHRALPHGIVEWSVKQFAQPDRRKAQTSTTKILAGIVVYCCCFGAYTAVVHRIFGWPASFWYLLSLPLATMLAYYHLRELRRLKAAVRNVVVLWRAPFATRRLLARRAELVQEIEAARSALRPPARTPSSPTENADERTR